MGGPTGSSHRGRERGAVVHSMSVGEGTLRGVRWLSRSHAASKWQDKGSRLSFLVTVAHAVNHCAKMQSERTGSQ